MNLQDPEPPKYFIDQQGVLVADKDWKERKSDIIRSMVRYDLPEDLGEILFLEVKDVPWRLEGRQIVLQHRPELYVPYAITLHYKVKAE